MYIGEEKPKDINDFISNFCGEVRGFQISGGAKLRNGKIMKFEIGVFVTDTPTRSFLTGIKYFNATHGCHRCHQKNVSDPVTNLKFFNYKIEENVQKRTDDSFASCVHPDHHHYLGVKLTCTVR